LVEVRPDAASLAPGPWCTPIGHASQIPGQGLPAHLSTRTHGWSSANLGVIRLDEPTRALSVSQTTLNLLRECPRCFWFHTKAHVARPRDGWPSVLVRIDEVVCAYWNRYARRGELPPMFSGTLQGVPVTPNLEAWYDRVTGLYLTGRLDACLKIDGRSFAPVDHKSRGSHPRRISSAYLLQLDLYQLLLEKNGYPSAGYGVLNYYIPDKCDLSKGLALTVEVSLVNTSTDRALDWLVRAREVLEMEDPPAPSDLCLFCRWLVQVNGKFQKLNFR